MEDVNISKFRAQVVRAGSTPASPGFVVSEGQNPVDPSGSGQNHLPVTIATASTGLSITESQVLGGAGTVGQYIRGDGSLADFPATTGGGSSVSYYLNGSVSQGTINGVAYKELNKTPVFGAGTDITINADGYIASFITDAGDPNKLLIPAGNWNLETYFSASSNGGSPSFYVELYKYNGTTFTLIATSSSAPELIAFGTNLNPYFSTLAVPETVLALTDRLALRYYVTHSGRTITLHTENNHLCQVITTFTSGLTALNGLTSQVQYLTVGTSGTDFAISSASDTHTFNLPTASATNRGALSSADWSTFNGKQNALTNPVTGTGTSGQVAYFTGTSAISSESNLVWDATNNRLGISVAIPIACLHVADATTTTRIYIDNTANAAAGAGIFMRTFNGATQVSNATLRTDNAGNLEIFTGTTGDAKQMTITSGGNIGIGTTGSPISAGTYYTTLELKGRTGGTGNEGGYYLTTDADGSTIGQLGVDGNFVYLGSRSNTDAVITSNNSERIRVFAGGNVHIGSTPTSDAGQKFQVNGSSKFFGNVEFTGTLFLEGSGNSYNIKSDSSNNFIIGLGATERMRITSGGNVGIGTNSPASQATGATTGILDVSASAGGNLVLHRTGSSDTALFSILKASNGTYIDSTGAATAANNAIIFRVNNNNADQTTVNDAMRITSSGTVGIGTPSPSSILHLRVANATNNVLTIDSPSGNNIIMGGVGTGITYVQSFEGSFEVGNTFSGGDFRLKAGNTERMRITSGGQIVMGRTTPSAAGRLTVDGDLYLHNITSGAGNSTLKYNYTSTGLVTYDTSSRLLKKNIENLSYGLEDVLKMSAKKYNWKRDESIDLGFIADEMVKIIPEIVFFSTQMTNQTTGVPVGEPLSINYDRLIPVLVKAIQELKQEIDTLKS